MDAILNAAVKGKYRSRHPMNRIDAETGRKIENELNTLLQPYFSAVDGINTCRLYIHYINTCLKL